MPYLVQTGFSKKQTGNMQTGNMQNFDIFSQKYRNNLKTMHARGLNEKWVELHRSTPSDMLTLLGNGCQTNATLG